MSLPKPGDRILIVKEPWLSLILAGKKKMEIRGARLSSGKWYLGFKKQIYGVMVTGKAQHIPTSNQFRELRGLHRVSGSLPYKKTFGLPIQHVSVLKPMFFTHPRGAQSIVLYR